MTDWTLCGWRVRSEIPLPEAIAWQGAADHPVDLSISLGDVPEAIEGSVGVEPLSEVGADGSYLLCLPNVGRYLVRGGVEITVAPKMPADSPDVRLFLETNCLSAIALQRGLLALHASVVLVEGRVIAIVGTAGQGKSTLAAALALRGHRFLAEDFCALDGSAATTDGAAWAPPLVVPSLPNIRLWEDALERFGIDASGLVQSRRGMRKYHLVRPDLFHAKAAPLDAMVMLRAAQPPLWPAGMRRARGEVAVGQLSQLTRHPALARVLGREADIIRLSSEMVRSGRVYQLGAVREEANLATLAEAVEQLARELTG